MAYIRLRFDWFYVSTLSNDGLTDDSTIDNSSRNITVLPTVVVEYSSSTPTIWVF